MLSLSDDRFNPYAFAKEKEFMKLTHQTLDILPTNLGLNEEDFLLYSVFTVSTTQTITERSQYHLLNFIGDVGALLGTLI